MHGELGIHKKTLGISVLALCGSVLSVEPDYTNCT